jgi:hypothetical protein
MKKMMFLSLAASLLVMTSGCKIVEGFLIAVNIKGVSGAHRINPGDPFWGPPPDADTTFHSHDYLDPAFSDQIKDVNIYGVNVWVEGNLPGGVVNSAQVFVNGVEILALNGATPWDSLKAKQSLVTSPRILRRPGGLLELIRAIRSKQDVRINSVGALNQNAPAGLKVYFEILGQVKAEP